MFIMGMLKGHLEGVHRTAGSKGGAQTKGRDGVQELAPLHFYLGSLPGSFLMRGSHGSPDIDSRDSPGTWLVAYLCLCFLVCEGVRVSPHSTLLPLALTWRFVQLHACFVMRELNTVEAVVQMCTCSGWSQPHTHHFLHQGQEWSCWAAFTEGKVLLA